LAHYAILDSNNVVIHVTTGKDENNTDYERDGKSSWEQWYKDYFNASDCKRTSYNTNANVHKLGGTPFRKNYAGKGFTYDSSKDAFISPKPFASWVLNETTCIWETPVTYPSDGKNYNWNEDTTSWVEVTGYGE
tara:strand:+ start:1077 stop:1478 length:402 start_codon:yes stop_codon:yes gene_type:complete